MAGHRPWGGHRPGAFLARTVTNLCLNALTSARARREVYVGPWLPEPVLTGSDADALGPLDDALQRESVSLALLLLLERLSPAERAAYVLREAFAYSAREVAELIGTTEANARQLHARARRHIDVPQVREVDAARWHELVARFMDAARDGDLPGLGALLAADVVSRADGGGIVNAARRPVRGRENVARYVAGLVRRFQDGFVPIFVEVNGAPAVAFTAGGTIHGVLVPDTDGERLTALDLIVNPEKLAFAVRQLSRMGGAAWSTRVTKGEPPMQTTLVTGATGTLGTPTTACLRAAGHHVRALSRRSGPGLTRGDLLTGAGLREAVAGADTVVHLATGRRGKGDVEATRTLLDGRHGGGGRALRAHLHRRDRRHPVGVLPGQARHRASGRGLGSALHHPAGDAVPLVRGGAADRPAPLAGGGRAPIPPAAGRGRRGRPPAERVRRRRPAGRVADVGGPEQHSLTDLARLWADATGTRRPVMPLSLPGRLFAAYRSGSALVAGPAYGRQTFADHLAATAGART